MGTVVVIGGGFAGTGVARRIERRIPSDWQVVLISAENFMTYTPLLVSEFAPSLGEAALKSMDRHGMEVHLHALASEVTATGVTTDAGDLILGANVICTIGTVPNPLLETLDVNKQKDLIATAPDMSVPDQPGLWAIGDCAAVVNAHDGALSPPTAQFAVRQARQVADNIVRAIDGQATRPFRYRPRGQVASIGHRRAVGEVFGLRLSGFPAWLLFPRDTSQLHLARTASPQSAEEDEKTPVASGQ